MRRFDQPLSPAEEPAPLLFANLQRLHAARQAELALALTGGQVREEVLRRQQERDALPTGVGDEADLRPRLRGQHQTRADRQAVDRPRRLRPEGDVGDQAERALCASAREGWSNGTRRRRPRDERSLVAPEKAGMKLHRILVDQLDACSGSRGIVELGDRDRRAGVVAAGSRLFAFCGIPIDGPDARFGILMLRT